MKNNTTYTSSIKISLARKLSHYSHKLNVPKNKIIERALDKYFDELKRAEYIRSFKRASNDPDIIEMTEEGIDDYVEILKRYE